eukprot:SAG22_NODE_683_length_7924_cov_13.017508_7_plen_69_part_00
MVAGGGGGEAAAGRGAAMAAPAVAAATDSSVRTSGRLADDDVLAGVDDALAAALGALDAVSDTCPTLV